MAVVQGIREQIHGPVYDALKVPAGKQLRDAEPTSTLRFFVNVQNKTKLETNLQSAALLPHYNTFEARAMRVVISDLPPTFSEDPTLTVKIDGELLTPPETVPAEGVLQTNLKRAMELLAEAREGEGKAIIAVDPATGTASNAFTYTEAGGDTDPTKVKDFEVSIGALEAAIDDLDRKAPPNVQVRPNNGAGTIISKFIYNTVTTLYVGEKIMIQMPTWFFPAGAGPFSEAGHFTTHGQPDPMATFRFAEPVFIDKQQNFRVEIEVPDKDILEELHRLYGPLFIWVVLDGFMTRDVQ
jgi:hypothetical protein